MSYRSLALISLFLFPAAAVAQQPDCKQDIAIDVIRPNGEAIEGLSSPDFAAQFKKQPLAIETAYDGGPRRILLIMDGSRDLAEVGRKAQVEFANAVISSAQAGDSLALITARGSTPEVKFGADRESVQMAVSDNAEEQKESHLGVLDAVAEGIGWFGEPKVGDTIILMAKDLEGNHKTNYKNVARMLAQRHIRLFGVAFGRLQLTTDVASNFSVTREGLGYQDPGMPMYGGQYGDANFLPLSVNSGGYIAPEDTMNPSHEFKLTEQKKQELQKTAANMMKLIDKVYVVRLPSLPSTHSEPWSLSLNQTKAASLPGSHVLYPHELACSGR